MSTGGSYIADPGGVTLVECTRDHELGNRPRHADETPVHRQETRASDPVPSTHGSGADATAPDPSAAAPQRTATKKDKE